MFRNLALILLLLLPLLSSAQGHTTVSAVSPRIIVGIVIEDMHPDYIERYWNKFGEDGFKRIYSMGYICANHHIDNLIQRPSVGMATLSTGATPSKHGIVADKWIDRLRNKETDCVADNFYTTVGSDSKEGERSAKWLMTPTIGDRMKLVTKGKARVFSVAMNDIPAIFAAGHSADGAYWLDNTNGKMISSSCYVSTFPGWAIDFNNLKMADSYLNQPWTPLTDPINYFESIEDPALGKTGYLGKYKNFPYNLALIGKEAGYLYRLLKTTPYANTLVKDFTIQLIPKERLGYDQIPDILTVVFSSMDAERYAFGAFSTEMQDTYMRLDKDIAELLKYLENGYGTENLLVYLTSTTSFSYPSEFLKDRYKFPTGTFNPDGSVALLKSYLNIKYGEGDWIELYNYQQIFLNRSLAEKKKIDIQEMQTVVAQFMNQFEGIAYAKAAFELESDNFLGGPLESFQNNYNIKRSGDVLIRFEDGWLPKEKYKPIDYTDCDQVPLVWFGAGIKKGTTLRHTSATDIVPTIAAFLGIVPPNSSNGEVITEILPQK